ncbi:uncharacterized protein G2W53_017216 [Senna tora]|uniref:Uncharacterized protein n=1 Tax=Senna tora TaxID=362788 RepID=A0A834TQF1_9FABA|nr:uncharacterized protein G2W53_017216 [Senna tora]
MVPYQSVLAECERSHIIQIRLRHKNQNNLAYVYAIPV